MNNSIIAFALTPPERRRLNRILNRTPEEENRRDRRIREVVDHLGHDINRLNADLDSLKITLGYYDAVGKEEGEEDEDGDQISSIDG